MHAPFTVRGASDGALERERPPRKERPCPGMFFVQQAEADD
jgi:hypothetical protein